MALWNSITGNPKAQLSVVYMAWDQFIITCWLLFVVNQISPKTEQILFHEPRRAQWKREPKSVLPDPNHTRQILNQASPKVSWSVGEVLPFLRSKGTFALASMEPELLSPQDFISGQFLNCGYGRSSLERRSLLDSKPAAFPSPSFLSMPPLYPQGHGRRGMLTAKERILFYQSKPSVMNLWPSVRHDSGSIV